MVDQIFDDGHQVAIAAHHSGDEFECDDSNARISDMGIYAYPTLIPDGQPEPTYPYNYDQLVGVINDRLAVPSPCTISVTGNLIVDDLTVNVIVAEDAAFTMENARVQVVVTEIDIPYPDPNYNNEMNFVNRDMILDNNGTALNFSGGIAEATVTGTLDPSWTQDNLIIVVWVENGASLEVYQATRENIEIFMADPNAPASPTDFVTTPDPSGALSCDISWTNPSLDFSGNTLTELLEMRLYKDGDLIYTDSNPTIGGTGNYTDIPIEPELYNYMVVGYNSFGEGTGAVSSTWVGEDVPNAVQDLVLEDVAGSAHITWTNPTNGLNGGAYNNPILGYTIVRNDGQQFDLVGNFTEFTDAVPVPDYYSYTITPYNVIGFGGSAVTDLVWIGDVFNGIIIVDLDPTSTGETLQAALENHYEGTVVVTSDISGYPITSAVDAVFVLLGVYSNNYALTETEAVLLEAYLNSGGNLYMEGGDTWAFDQPTSVHPYFNITGVADGDPDLATVDGHDFLEGFSWSYSGENFWIDQLAPIAPAVTIFSNPDVGYDCGVAHDSGTYKTVGTSFEITGLGGTNTLDEAVAGIMDFFGPFTTPLLPPTNLAVDAMTGLFTWDEPSPDVFAYDIYLDGQLTGFTYDLQFQFTNLTVGTLYEAGIYAVYDEGISDMVTIEFTYEGTEAGNNLPLVTELKGNYPNPFNPSTLISYSLKEDSQVSLIIYNIKGQKVKTLRNEELDAGYHSVSWNGDDDSGKAVSSGVYFYKLKTGNYQNTKKMILMK